MHLERWRKDVCHFVLGDIVGDVADEYFEGRMIRKWPGVGRWGTGLRTRCMVR